MLDKEDNKKRLSNKFLSNINAINKAIWLYLFLMLVWLFVALIMPAIANAGGSQGAYVNAFYNSELVNNIVVPRLSDLGISTIFFFLVGIILTITFLYFYFHNGIYKKVFEKSKHHQIKQYFWWINFALLLSLVIIFFGLAMAQPNISALTTNWIIYNQIQQVNTDWAKYQNALDTGGQAAANSTININEFANSVLKLVSDMKINLKELNLSDSALLDPSSVDIKEFNLQASNVLQAINNHNLGLPTGQLTPIWSIQTYPLIAKTSGWYAVASLFGIVLSLLFLLPLIGAVVVKANLEQRKEYRESIKLMLQNIKQQRKERNELKKSKKALREKEDELLSNLEKIKLDNNSDVNVVEQLSQQELEEQISKANALKEEIETLRYQREMMNQQTNSKQKQNVNRQPTRPKKQKIAVPDEELEDIFKSLDID